MTDEIEREALALLRTVCEGRGVTFRELRPDVYNIHAALYRAIEQLHAERAAHEATKAEFTAFRQEVSNVACEYNEHGKPVWWRGFDRFILPQPDPIAEWLHASGYEGNAAVEQAVRAYAKENSDETR
jgi:hypothetical protein